MNRQVAILIKTTAENYQFLDIATRKCLFSSVRLRVKGYSYDLKMQLFFSKR